MRRLILPKLRIGTLGRAAIIGLSSVLAFFASASVGVINPTPPKASMGVAGMKLVLACPGHLYSKRRISASATGLPPQTLPGTSRRAFPFRTFKR
jgi:hypothetical protein